MVVKSAVGTAIALSLAVAAAGCGARGGAAGDERPAPASSSGQWSPEAGLPSGVRMVVRGAPDGAGSGGAGYDYGGAARGALEIQAALARAEYERGGPEGVLAHAAPGSPAAEMLKSRVDAAAEAPAVPVGTYVLRDFEVGGFAKDLVQIDFCLDQRDVRMRPADGGPTERRADRAEDVVWAGFTMRPDGNGAWRAEEVQLTPVGTDGAHHCMS